MPKTSVCGATTRAGGACQRPAGWGTGHPGQGRCKLHGGASPGAPAGNRNALKTGEYETIYADVLDEKERLLFDTIDTDKLAQVNEQIRLSSIRMHRMLRRIQELTGQDYILYRKRERTTTDEKVFKSGARSSGGEDGERVDRTEKHTTTQTETEERSTLGLVQAIEEALTRVVQRHTQLLNLKHQIEQNEPPEDDADVSGFVDALEGKVEDLPWPDQE